MGSASVSRWRGDGCAGGVTDRNAYWYAVHGQAGIGVVGDYPYGSKGQAVVSVGGTDRVGQFGLAVGAGARQQDLAEGLVAGGDGELDAAIVRATLARGVQAGAGGGQVDRGAAGPAFDLGIVEQLDHYRQAVLGRQPLLDQIPSRERTELAKDVSNSSFGSGVFDRSSP
jgi:hypothetical protein